MPAQLAQQAFARRPTGLRRRLVGVALAVWRALEEQGRARSRVELVAPVQGLAPWRHPPKGNE